MKPSTPSTPAPEQTIPVKAESVGEEVGEDYQARGQRAGMISHWRAAILPPGRERSIPGPCLGKPWDRHRHGRERVRAGPNVQVLAHLAAPWETWWDRLRDYVLPRHHKTGRGGFHSTRRHHGPHDPDATARPEACPGSWPAAICPTLRPAMTCGSSGRLRTTGERRGPGAWYQSVFGSCLKGCPFPNFCHTRIHGCFWTAWLKGDQRLFAGTSSDGRLLFTNIPCGQFACAENAEGRVDTYVREFTYTAHQARSMFGMRPWGPGRGRCWNAAAIRTPCP